MMTVVLVNWNGWADTLACLQSLLAATPTASRIVVVDNASTDGSIDNMVRWAARQLELLPQGNAAGRLAQAGASRERRVTVLAYDECNGSFSDDVPPAIVREDGMPIYVVKSGRNGGFGFGCNVGLRLGRKLGSSAFWLLNNDCVVTPDTLRRLHDTVLKSPRVIFGTILRFYHQPEKIQTVGGGHFSRFTGSVRTIDRFPLTRPLDFINGASLAMSTACVDEVGEFDEKIFMYFEENDYCIRAALRGYSFDVVPVDVFHKQGGSQGRAPSAKSWAAVLQNKYYVLKKHFGWGPWTVFFFAMLVARSVLPLGLPASRKGARETLRALALGVHKT